MFFARLFPHMPNNQINNTNKNIANRLRKTSVAPARLRPCPQQSHFPNPQCLKWKL